MNQYSRMVSVIILLLILVAIAVPFYRVMSIFILPLFLAGVLTVVFRPLHRWMLAKLRGRQTLAAAATTFAILLSVLAPLCIILTLAVHEGNQLLARQHGDLLGRLKAQVASFGERMGLQRPFVDEFRQMQRPLDRIDKRLDADLVDDKARASIAAELQSLAQHFDRLADGIAQANELIAQMEQAGVPPDQAAQQPAVGLSPNGVPPVAPDKPSLGPAELAGVHRLRREGSVETTRQQLTDWSDALRTSAKRLEAPEADDLEWADQIADQAGIARLTIVNLDTDLRGGPLRAWASDLVNPDESRYQAAEARVRQTLQHWLPTLTGQATALVGSLVFGTIIMIIAVFYFFLDGAGMVRSVMKLSPLDDEYERQLLAEFDKSSRAVVVATLLSAATQGVLAGVGYFVLGIDAVFLLTLVTMVLALVPFVGAAAVWIPVCLLLIVDGRWTAAVMMAIWGAGVVSMADNVIKPLVLRGQSNLHPLLGLLSVLGGVQALGPIGILVGPMVISILHAVLTMVNNELNHINGKSGESPLKPALAQPPASAEPVKDV